MPRNTKAEGRELEALYDDLVALSRTRCVSSPQNLSRIRKAQRWLSDQFALWRLCGNAACLRAGRCRGPRLGCHRFEMPRVPHDAKAGLDLCLAAYGMGDNPAAPTKGPAVAALIAWRQRFGLPPLPAPPTLRAPQR